MGRAPCCSKVGLHRGPWTPKEDALLTKYIQAHGEGQWRSLPKRAGLLRCGKSCRLRWMNYLRPDIKRGNISPEEDDLIIRMHSLLGNRWSLIAGRLPGRTDNEIKNYWNTHLSKKLKTTQLGVGVGSDRHLQAAKKKNSNKKKKKQQAKNNSIKSNKNNVEMIVMEEEEGEIEEKKTNIYLPKPIRVRAFSIHRHDSTTTTTTLTLDSNINGCSSAASGSSSQDKEESPSELVLQKEVNYGLWDESDGFGFFIDNIDIVNGSISEDNNNNNNMECLSSLDKLYEEYFQLLKNNNNNIREENQGELDSFAQSLFV